MHICYIDEAGCPGRLPSSTSDVQPLLVITGIFIQQNNLVNFTRDFLTLKSSFNPSVRHRDIARHEIKGSDLRRDIRRGNRNTRRRTMGFLDKSLDTLQKYGAKHVTRIYVKEPSGGFNGKAVYTSSVQQICSCFQQYLIDNSARGIVIADSRTPGLNSIVSHSIFTQKFRANGADPYQNILEAPVFGHSENHAALQLTDFLSSAILFPSASEAYCTGHVNNIHVHPNDNLIRTRYLTRLKNMSYRFDDGGRCRGGITVIDAIAQRNSSLLFRP